MWVIKGGWEEGIWERERDIDHTLDMDRLDEGVWVT